MNISFGEALSPKVRRTAGERLFFQSTLFPHLEPKFPNSDYLRALERSMKGALGFAKSREAKKATKGRQAVAVTVTLDQLMAKLKDNGYCCVLSGLAFWEGNATSFGPYCPSIDRIDPKGDYSDANTRVVLLGVNAMRGEGTDDDVYRIAEALSRKRAKAGEDLASPEGAS